MFYFKLYFKLIIIFICCLILILSLTKIIPKESIIDDIASEVLDNITGIKVDVNK